jgi:hypothetical protein
MRALISASGATGRRGKLPFAVWSLRLRAVRLLSFRPNISMPFNVARQKRAPATVLRRDHAHKEDLNGKGLAAE